MMISATKLLVFVLLASSTVKGSTESLSRPSYLDNLIKRLPLDRPLLGRRLSQFDGPSGGGSSSPGKEPSSPGGVSKSPGGGYQQSPSRGPGSPGGPYKSPPAYQSPGPKAY
ncbi:hypothetical protein WJX79_003120 [Trebouxia sp. C0005]